MEELNTALATLIEQATTGIDASVSFLQAELPDVIYQLLMWHGVKSAVYFSLGLSLFCYGMLAGGAISRNAREKISNAKAAYEAGESWTRYSGGTVTSMQYDFVLQWNSIYPLILRGFSIFIGALIAINELTWLQIWIAPKVWLLEYAAKLVS